MKPTRLFLLLSALIAITGCVSMQQIDSRPGESLADTIRQDSLLTAGDVVEITRQDGYRIEGSVLRVSPETIVLEGGQIVRIDDVAALRVRKVSIGRTVAAGTAGWLGIVAVTAAVTFMNFIGVL